MKSIILHEPKGAVLTDKFWSLHVLRDFWNPYRGFVDEDWNHYVIGDMKPNGASGLGVGSNGSQAKIVFANGIVLATNNLWQQGEVPVKYRKDWPIMQSLLMWRSDPTWKNVYDGIKLNLPDWFEIPYTPGLIIGVFYIRGLDMKINLILARLYDLIEMTGEATENDFIRERILYGMLDFKFFKAARKKAYKAERDIELGDLWYEDIV